jgi:hypothetical protein
MTTTLKKAFALPDFAFRKMLREFAINEAGHWRFKGGCHWGVVFFTEASVDVESGRRRFGCPGRVISSEGTVTYPRVDGFLLLKLRKVKVTQCEKIRFGEH